MSLPNTSLQSITSDTLLSQSKPKFTSNFEDLLENDDYLNDRIDDIGIYTAKSYLTMDGITDDYTALSNLITDIGSDEAEIWFKSGTALIGSSITIPSNINLKFLKGAKLSIASGKTVTINGIVEAGLYQIFIGSGSVSLGKQRYVEAEWFGAIKETTSTIALQKAIDAVTTGSTIKFNSIYYINGVLTISKAIRLFGENKYTSGIKNYGTGHALVISSWDSAFTIVENMTINGNGGGWGVGATDKSGICLSGAYWVDIKECLIQYHGEHGISFNPSPISTGSWNINIHHCNIEYNKYDGIYCVATSGADQKNANNFSYNNLANNGRHGVSLWGANINVENNTIQGNLNCGIIIDESMVTNLTYGCLQINILKNYFELNKDGFIQIKTKYDASDPLNIINRVAVGINIKYNYGYMNAVSVNPGITSLVKITTTGQTSPSSPGIKTSTYEDNLFFSSDLYVFDGGGYLGESFNIKDTFIDFAFYTKFINLGRAQVRTHTKISTIHGYSNCLGLTYSSMDKSDNFSGTTTFYYALNMQQNTSIGRLGMYIDTDSTGYTIQFKLQGRDGKTIDSYSDKFSETLGKTGSELCLTSYFEAYVSDHLNTRYTNTVSDFIVKITVTPTTGTYFKAGNLVVYHS